MLEYHHLQSPTVIGTLQLGAPKELREQWAKEAYNLTATSYITNLYGQMSSFYVWEETKIYDQLLKKILTIINETYIPTAYEKHLSCEEHKLIKYDIAEAWTAIYREGEFAKPHSHYPYPLAFCYYIKVGENSTPIIFNDLNFSIKPKDDMLIIFNAHIFHSVPSHKGKDRIIAAGNLNLPKK